MTTKADKLEDIELKLLLEGIYCHYGYDFRGYISASIRRCVDNVMMSERLATISQLQNKVLHDTQAMAQLVSALTINVTSMFRDPKFYLAFRNTVVPRLRTYPFIRLWHAGCATGEEVYSTAIVLEETGLCSRSRQYATDLDETVLKRAKAGIFPLADMQAHTSNYQSAGGIGTFSDYYTAKYDAAIFHARLKRNLVFAQHDLVTGGVFNQFHVIICRNVMMYFNPSLQARVRNLFHNSLERRGLLILGQKETLRLNKDDTGFELVDPVEKIYRKIG